MAKSTKKARKLTTSEALEQLLGRKAAKRLRQLAMQLAADENDKKKPTKRKRRR
jgi:hypothetical protein